MADAKTQETGDEQFITFKENVDDKEVSKKYLIKDMSDDSKLIYNKLVILQKQKDDLVANAHFEIECKEVLIKHFMSELKENLPEETKEESEEEKLN